MTEINDGLADDRPKVTRDDAAPALLARAAPLPGKGGDEGRSSIRPIGLRRIRLPLALIAGDLLAALPAQIILTGVAQAARARAIVFGVLGLPLCNVAFKLPGLYGLDRQLLRHSTVDEIPRLIAASTSATVLVTAVLVASAGCSPTTNELLVSAIATFASSFLLRGTIRNGWRRFAPRETGILIGSGDLALATLRRLQLNP